MSLPKLRVEEVDDPVARENFQRLDEELKNQPFLKGKWRFIEITFGAATANCKFRHGFNFIPQDAFAVRITNNASVTWHYDDFDRTNVLLTVTDACTVRAFIGSYGEA